MIEFAGVEKTSLIDYPGNICATLFLSGCNFRCPYCYNSALIEEKKPAGGPDENEVILYLKTRQGLLDGICITGGEPTLNSSLACFLSRVKDLGFKVKLDTNGSSPAVVAHLLENRLVDYAAVDIKNSPELYDDTCGRDIPIKQIENTVRLLRRSRDLLEYELRTTVVPGLHDEEAISSLRDWLDALWEGERTEDRVEKYVIQQFKPQQEVLNPDYRERSPLSAGQLKKFSELLSSSFSVEIRGL